MLPGYPVCSNIGALELRGLQEFRSQWPCRSNDSGSRRNCRLITDMNIGRRTALAYRTQQ